MNNKQIKYQPEFILLDTNFVYFAIKNKINLITSLGDCLNAMTVPCVTECVILELEKLGPKFKLALNYLKNRNIIKIKCCHPKHIIYADDCIFNTLSFYQYFFAATCDVNLRRRLNKIAISRVIYIKKNKFFLT